MTTIRALACAVAAIGLATQAVAAPAPDRGAVPRLERSACATDALRDRGAECHTLYVRENRDAPGGRVVELPVAVLRASGAERDSDPVVYFPGGPGSSAISRGTLIDQLRRDAAGRDLVLFEGRGFAHARPALHCPGWDVLSPWYNPYTPAIVGGGSVRERIALQAEFVERCYARLRAEGIDTTRYNEYEMVRDVEDLRRLLGLRGVVAYGESTGGGSALSYLRYFPANVRAVVLVVPWFPALRNRAPIEEYYAARQTITDALAACPAEHAACRALLPDALLAVERTRRALDAAPFRAEVRGPDGAPVTLVYDGSAFLHSLYTDLPGKHARLPAVLHEVPAGRRDSLAEYFGVASYTPAPSLGAYAWGYYFAHVCGDAGRHKPTREDALAMLEREPGLLGFEPNVFCGWWDDVARVPAEHSDPLHSDVPVLSMHGQLDPCCGRRWGEHLARTMPNVQVVEIRGHGHGLPRDCRTTLIGQFLRNPGGSVDTACALSAAPQWRLPVEARAKNAEGASRR